MLSLHDPYPSTLGTQGWYPANDTELRSLLQEALDAHSVIPSPSIKALICPHAGYRYCADVFAAAMACIQTGAYSQVVIIGPSHYVPLRDQAVLCGYSGIQTPLGTVAIDHRFDSQLCKAPYFKVDDAVHAPEHSIQMMLPFLQVCLPDVPIVPIVIGDLRPDVARSIATTLRTVIDPKTLLMISSDFTHYGESFGYQPFLDLEGAALKEAIHAVDMGAIDPIVGNDLAAYSQYIFDTTTTICGRFAIQILLSLCKDSPTDLRLCDYQLSGDHTGDYSHSVSYASLAIEGAWT
ncbi:MAG: AmmeMemoRadiSam system protein B [bacterium]